MELWSRKKLQKVGKIKHTDVDYFDENHLEPSLAEEDKDSGDDYTAGAKQKLRKKSRDSVEEPRQKKVRKDKSQVSSRGYKRTLKDASAEKTEKRKLNCTIRNERMKEVKTLLETAHEEIDPMKLSAAHLRLLQEARKRVDAKEIPSGPSSNTSSFQLEDMDDLHYSDEDARNFNKDRTENHVENFTKLNYHSYMKKQTRAKWSKPDTDLFYKGLRQFGSDFAVIQQLIPGKTRQQVRAKFKTEEKKNPLQVHDALIHRSVDNWCFKKVIKQLNIEDVLPEFNNTNEQEGASNEGPPGNEDARDGFINEDEEEDGSHVLNENYSVHMSDAQVDDDDLGNVFDWY